MKTHNTVISGFLLFLLVILPAYAGGENKEAQILESFIASYHRKPSPTRVPDMLNSALKLVSGEPSPFDAPNGPVLIAHAFGYMAKNQPKMVRLYEARFDGASKQGKQFLVEALRIAGDGQTARALKTWADNPRNAEVKKEIEAGRTFLADPQRKYPRDRPARYPGEIDYLWADFFVTGDFAPVARILDVLDEPRSLRTSIEKRLKSPLPNSAKGPDVLARRKMLGLMQPNTKEKLVEGDLELLILYDRKGRLRGDGLALAVFTDDPFDLKNEDLVRAILANGAAAWSLQSNLDQHPRLAQLLKEHYRDRKPRSQELIKRWLKIDQVFQLSKEAKELQGTWQAFAEERAGGASDPKLIAETLKYVRWTFDEDECSATKALTLNSTKVIGQGGTNVTTFQIDSTMEPKRIVFTSIGGDDWTTAYPSIYKLEGDVLTVCMSTGKEFPKGFSAKSGTVLKLRKIKGR